MGRVCIWRVILSWCLWRSDALEQLGCWSGLELGLIEKHVGIRLWEELEVQRLGPESLHFSDCSAGHQKPVVWEALSTQADSLALVLISIWYNHACVYACVHMHVFGIIWGCYLKWTALFFCHRGPGKISLGNSSSRADGILQKYPLVYYLLSGLNKKKCSEMTAGRI